MQHPKINLSQICVKGQSQITALVTQNDALCLQILIALLALRAFNSDSGLTLRAVARTIGAHHQQIRRRIIGDKHCRSRLKGLVRWENGRGRKGTRVWLSPQGKAVAVGLLACVPFSDETLIRFFEDPQKWLRLLALLVTDQKRQPTPLAKNGTPTLKNMFRPNGVLNEDLKVRHANEFKTFVRATTAIFNQTLTRNDFGFRCKVGKTLLAEFTLDAAIGIIRHAQRAWSNATPAQVLRFALKHKEALFEAHLRECERRENLKRIRAVMRPFVDPTEKPKQPPMSPPIKGDRAERAAEIVAADQPLQPIAQSQRGKKRCPRCGAEGFELVLKRFERYYPEILCPEADRWNGVEVCGYCFKALRIDEMKAVLAVKGDF